MPVLCGKRKLPIFATDYSNQKIIIKNVILQFYLQDAMCYYEEYRILDKHNITISKASDKIYRAFFCAYQLAKAPQQYRISICCTEMFPWGSKRICHVQIFISN